MTEPTAQSRNDDVTIPCPACPTRFAPSGRRRYCSDASGVAGTAAATTNHNPPPRYPPKAKAKAKAEPAPSTNATPAAPAPATKSTAPKSKHQHAT